MATKYMKTMRPSLAAWTPEDHARFDAILAALPFESYPNGNFGWKDREHKRFIDAGFCITKQDHGNEYMPAWAYFDLAVLPHQRRNKNPLRREQHRQNGPDQDGETQ